MRLVVLLRLVVGDADFPQHFVLLYTLKDHRALEIPAQVGHRHALGLERGQKLLVVLDLVFLADVVDDLLELLFAQLVAKLFPALDDDHFVDRLDHDLRRDFVERLAQLLVRGIALEVELLAFLPQRRHLALFEIALGEDFAVHLHEDLLDDFRARRHAGRDER